LQFVHDLPCFRAVSIHARTRRATGDNGLYQWEQNVSIHARTRRATFPALQQIFPAASFQSTPAHGGRPTGSPFTGAIDGFNPRPHTAGDFIKIFTAPES